MRNWSIFSDNIRYIQHDQKTPPNSNSDTLDYRQHNELMSYIFGIFSKTEQYFLLLDKLLADSVMASSRSEENVVLNNFQHKRCISVGIPS